MIRIHKAEFSFYAPLPRFFAVQQALRGLWVVHLRVTEMETWDVGVADFEVNQYFVEDDLVMRGKGFYCRVKIIAIIELHNCLFGHDY